MARLKPDTFIILSMHLSLSSLRSVLLFGLLQWGSIVCMRTANESIYVTTRWQGEKCGGWGMGNYIRDVVVHWYPSIKHNPFV